MVARCQPQECQSFHALAAHPIIPIPPYGRPNVVARCHPKEFLSFHALDTHPNNPNPPVRATQCGRPKASAPCRDVPWNVSGTASPLSFQKIQEMVEANGDFVSERTLRRVFAEDADGQHFRYEVTLKPIARALLYTDNANGNKKEVEKSLKSIIHIKNEEIETLKEQIDSLKAEYQRRVDFLRSQIDLKDKRMDEKDEIIKKLMEKVLG